MAIATWPNLPEHIRQAILTLAQAAGAGDSTLDIGRVE
jgi:hypothetical protein